MTAKLITADKLSSSDLELSPVWEYVNDDFADETTVRPISRLPVRSLAGRIVGTRVRLANGDLPWATLENIDPSNPQLTEHFLLLSVHHNGGWFTLARYHDIDAHKNGPAALARFLGMSLNEVFPISYDITAISAGNPKALKGIIASEPRERLSRAEIIALAVP